MLQAYGKFALDSKSASCLLMCILRSDRDI